jgi:hypothetical protein
VPPEFAMPEPRKKSHIKKSDNFTKAKQWEQFRQQTLVYVKENQRYFAQGEQIICFLLSFMTRWLPEKFTVNYLNDLMDNRGEHSE